MVLITIPVNLNPLPSTSFRSSFGFVGGSDRLVEAHDTHSGLLLKVEDSSCLIDPSGSSIINLSDHDHPSQLDQDLITGPGLVLALSLQKVWCLHASAAKFHDTTFAFLGESGLGKSTLAGYLSRQPVWQLVADDILPVSSSQDGISALPRFPQLKLPPDAQPGLHLPESLPLHKLVLLESCNDQEEPVLEPLDEPSAAKILLSNTAGSRLFSPAVLSAHLAFCTQSAPFLSAYRLKYPHRPDALPIILNLLERSC